MPVPQFRAGRARNGDRHLEDSEPVPIPRPSRIASEIRTTANGWVGRWLLDSLPDRLEPRTPRVDVSYAGRWEPRRCRRAAFSHALGRSRRKRGNRCRNPARMTRTAKAGRRPRGIPRGPGHSDWPAFRAGREGQGPPGTQGVRGRSEMKGVYGFTIRTNSASPKRGGRRKSRSSRSATSGGREDGPGAVREVTRAAGRHLRGGRSRPGRGRVARRRPTRTSSSNFGM